MRRFPADITEVVAALYGDRDSRPDQLHLPTANI
jgi:hypothetical protein